MKNFFEGCHTIEEIKARYKALARKFHPDVGGDTSTMQEINRQYEEAFNAANTGKDGYQYQAETASEFIAVINALMKIQACITIELCGSWLWISGDTKPCKDELKCAGCKWAPKKKMWYWKPASSHSRGSGNTTIEYIRAKYGSRTFDRNGNEGSLAHS